MVRLFSEMSIFLSHANGVPESVLIQITFGKSSGLDRGQGITCEHLP